MQRRLNSDSTKHIAPVLKDIGGQHSQQEFLLFQMCRIHFSASIASVYYVSVVLHIYNFGVLHA